MEKFDVFLWANEVDEVKNNVSVEILPYHEYGKCKWVEEYEITDGFVSEETLKEFADALKNAGIKLINP